MRRILITCSTVLVVGALVLALTGPTSAEPRAVAVYGKAGTGFSITLKTAKGAPVKRLKAGTTYTFIVNDASEIHNFHLVGPGVNRKTTVTGSGTVRWTIKLRKGTYVYKCDPHAPSMQGSFTAT